MVGDALVGGRRPGEARQTDYITPFAINARVTCFRYDGRVAPQQIVRDGEVVSVDRLRVELSTQHFLVCTDEAKGVPAGTSSKLERFMQRLTLTVPVLPSEFTRLVPIVFTVAGAPRWQRGREQRTSRTPPQPLVATLGVSAHDTSSFNTNLAPFTHRVWRVDGAWPPRLN